MKFTTTNKKIAVAPFAVRDIKSKHVHGIAMMEHMVQLEKTTVVFPNMEGLEVGQTVYFSGEAIKHKWASEVMAHEGLKFILVPVDLVVAYDQE